MKRLLTPGLAPVRAPGPPPGLAPVRAPGLGPVRAAVALAAVLALAAAGCAREEEPSLPAACTTSFAGALRAAPDPVRVDGVSVSDCVSEGVSSGDVQAVGLNFLQTAQTLGREGDLVALGYLVGALQRGAADPHREIVRRVEQEASPFSRSAAYERGLRAGRSSG